MNIRDPTPEQLQADMEDARIDFERWRQVHRRPRASEIPSEFDGCRTLEDDRLDDPRHEPGGR